MTISTDFLDDALDAFGDDREESRFWLREIALVAGVTLLLVLDIGALGCDAGMPMLEHVALHLWGPGY
jgi:hypothetical protein